MGNSIASAGGGLSSTTHRNYPHTHHQGNLKTNPHKSAGRSNSNSNSSGTQQRSGGESSRILFLLYLIHRTWNVVVDSVDTRSKRSRLSARCSSSEDSGAPKSYFDDGNSWCGGGNDQCTITDLDEDSLCGSQYSFCSCSYCYASPIQNVYNSIMDGGSSSVGCQTISMCASDFSSFYTGYQMAPSICQNTPTLPPPPPHPAGRQSKTGCSGSQICSSVSYKMTNSENSWPQSFSNKENQRPPVYNPEDYVQSLKKYGKRQSGTTVKSIYDTGEINPIGSETTKPDLLRAATLPSKYSEYRSPIPSPPESDTEMSLRQFGSVTDLLTKLRADLRVSFPSFVQEFVATPFDGVSLLLEVLRAIQLSQTMNAPSGSAQMSGSIPRNAHSYQRRGLLDELACLQCLSICCSRSPEASARLGTTPVGLLPLAASATGQGIRARIFAMQLMTSACERRSDGHVSGKSTSIGHAAVSEAVSTLRLRCGEPVRFRLLVGMLNSGGGSGELQAVGVKFLNTFLESAENLQNRLYLQAELHQAGFEPGNLTKTISSSSPWLDNLRNEVRRFNELHIDIDKMQAQSRDSDRIRSQMVILERRVQILHEEKAVLTSMERRLQERCAELQREIFRLQGAQSENFKPIDNRPVALPRHVPPPNSKQDSSEHEDEGISSSETGPSLSPEPILVLPQNSPHQKFNNKNIYDQKAEDDATIEDVIEELENIVSNAEKEIATHQDRVDTIDDLCQSNKPIILEAKEKEIVPVNVLPQPPRKSRSLTHLMSQEDGSELDASEYGLLLMENHAHPHRYHHHRRHEIRGDGAGQSFFDEAADYDVTDDGEKTYHLADSSGNGRDGDNIGHNSSALIHPNTNREILDVIMNARHSDDDPTIKAFRECGLNIQTVPVAADEQDRQMATSTNSSSPLLAGQKPPDQHFNEVFFMSGMNTPQKYPKPDLSAALQARRVTKNIERIEAAFSHETLDEVARGKSLHSTQQIYFGSNPTLRINTSFGSYTNNVTVINNVTTRTRSYTQGSKVTDIPSGLY